MPQNWFQWLNQIVKMIIDVVVIFTVVDYWVRRLEARR